MIDWNFTSGSPQKHVLSGPPQGLAKEFPQFVKIHKCLNLIDCTMVLPIFTCKFDVKNTPDAFQHVPDMFRRAPGPENRVQDVNASPPKCSL